MTPRLDRYKSRHPRLCKHSFTKPDLSFTLHLTKNIHKWKTSEGNCCFAGTIDISDKNCCLTHDILICYQLNVDDPHEHKFALLKGIQHISREGFKSENLEKIRYKVIKNIPFVYMFQFILIYQIVILWILFYYPLRAVETY